MSFKITSDIINGLIVFDILFIILTIWTTRIKSKIPTIALSCVLCISIAYKFLLSDTAKIASTPVNLELQNSTGDELEICFIETDGKQNEKVFYWDKLQKDESKFWTFELESNLSNGLGLITRDKRTDSKKWLTVDLKNLPTERIEITKKDGLQLSDDRNRLLKDVETLELQNWFTTILTVVSALIIGFRFMQ